MDVQVNPEKWNKIKTEVNSSLSDSLFDLKPDNFIIFISIQSSSFVTKVFHFGSLDPQLDGIM